MGKGKGTCGGAAEKGFKEKKTQPESCNSSKNTCVLYPFQTELLLQGLAMRIWVAQEGSPDSGKQLLQV